MDADLARHHDVLGQLPFLKSYSHFLLGFAVQDERARDGLVKDLESATRKLTEAFPWLLSQVVHEDVSPGSSGRFTLRPCEAWSSILRVKDCCELCPSYSEIKRQNAITSLFDPTVLAPTVAFPLTYPESEETPAPMAVFQANFITGGLLLDGAAQHNFMDALGLMHLFNYLAKLMRGEELTAFEIEQGNRDRRGMIELLGPDEPLRDHSHLRRPPPQGSPPPALRAPAPWVLFCFPAAAVAKIKERASKPQDFDPSVSFITTNDALSAFCWKRVTAVRQRLNKAPLAMAKFCRAIDVRPTMGIPPEYLGHLVNIAVAHLTNEDIERSSLAFVSSALHKSVADVNDEYTVRSFTTLVANEPEKSTISFGGRFNPDTDIGSSSLAGMRIYDTKFGSLGEVEIFRRPNFAPLESDIYILPRFANGDVEVLICFTEAVTDGLKADDEWTAYAQFIG
jgi:trichothecene 3-O-acetyltransferase